jgi:hypothetical protein
MQLRKAPGSSLSTKQLEDLRVKYAKVKLLGHVVHYMELLLKQEYEPSPSAWFAVADLINQRLQRMGVPSDECKAARQAASTT